MGLQVFSTSTYPSTDPPPPKEKKKCITFKDSVNWAPLTPPLPQGLLLQGIKNGLSTFHLFWGLTSVGISSEWDEP